MIILKNKIINHKGFTLIELLIVMVIIGVILTFVVISFGDFGQKRELIMKQNHLADLIKLAKMRAVIESKTYGLAISKKNYTFYYFVHKQPNNLGTWIKLTDNVFKSTSLPRYKVFNYNQPRNPLSPEILISSEGEITPFILTLALIEKEKITLEVKKSGLIEVISIGST